MTEDLDSAECPVCGRSVPSDSVTCPHCGSDLSMSSLEELEKVAKSISTGGPMPGREPKPVVEAAKPSTIETKTEKQREPEAPRQKEPEGGKEGKRFGKFFGKKKK